MPSDTETGQTSTKKQDFIATARKRAKYAVESLAESREFELDDLKFFAGSPDNGWQWPKEIKLNREQDVTGARPCLTVNKLPQHVRQVTNDQRQNRPGIKVIPVDDKSDPDLAEVLNGVTRHIEVQSDADIAYDTASDNQVIMGEGYWRIVTEYCDDKSFDQDIFIRRIRNSFSVLMDPDISDPCGSDAKWCFITDEIDEDEFKEDYPKAEPVDWTAASRGDDFSLWFNTNTRKIRIAEYFHYEEDEKTLYLWPDGTTTFDKAMPEVGGALMQPVRTRKVELRKVIWSKINGQEEIERRDWAGKYIPVVRVVGNEFEVEGKLQISGLTRNAKDAQRMYNYWTSQEAEMLALAPKAPFVGATGQFEGYEDKWKKANVVNYPYLEYNPVIEGGIQVPPPQRVAPPFPQQGIISAKMGAADDIKGTTGQYDASLGQKSNETSGIAIRNRQHESDVGTFHYVDNFSRAVRHGGRIILDLIPKIYDTRRIARIIGEDGEADQVAFDPNLPQPMQIQQDAQGQEIARIYNPTMGKYDVVITTGPSFSTKRQEAREAMTQLVQTSPELWKIIGDLLVKNMDWPGAEEIADRLRRTVPPELLGDSKGDPKMELEKAKAIIQQLSQQVEAAHKAYTEMVGKLEVQKTANDAEELKIKAYDAETKRLAVAQKEPMTEEQMQDIVMGTIHGMLTSGDLIGPMPDRSMPDMQTMQPQGPPQ